MRISQILDDVFRAGYKAKMLGRAEHALAISDAEAKIKALVSEDILAEKIHGEQGVVPWECLSNQMRKRYYNKAKALKQHIDSL